MGIILTKCTSCCTTDASMQQSAKRPHKSSSHRHANDVCGEIRTCNSEKCGNTDMDIDTKH